jgi:hypothetical protein
VGRGVGRSEDCEVRERPGGAFYSERRLGRVRWAVAVANPRTRAHVRAVGADEGGHTSAWIGFWSALEGWVVGCVSVVHVVASRELLWSCTCIREGPGRGVCTGWARKKKRQAKRWCGANV